MHSLLAAWRVSLHRTGADWPIVAAAWLIVLLAATLLAAGPIYSRAVSLAGLHRVLEDASVADANIEVTARVDRADVAANLARVTAELNRTVGGLGLDVVATGRSDTFTLPGQQAEEVRDLVILAFLDRIEDHAGLLAGAWPVTAAPGGPMQVAISEQIGEDLDLAVGDALPLVSRLDASQALDLVVVGVYRPNDPLDAYWWNDPSLIDGIVESAQYRTFGPLVVTREELLGRAAGNTVPLAWHAYPHFEKLTIDQIGPLRAEIGDLPGRIEIAAVDGFPRVHTALGEILEASERSLLVSRTGILLLMAQLAILAAYAIVLTAALIVDHRRVDTALLRSRGAGPLQVGGLALAEGLLLAIPAGIAGPWIAAAALSVLNVAGPLAGIGLEIHPQVTGDAYLAAVAAAVGCALLLVLPALLAARSFAAEQAGRSRHETRPLGQRLGLDIALLAIAIVGIWQLRLYGAPLTRTIRGTLGLDPLLVAAPAIGLLTGGVVALRLLPLLAQAAEGILARGRDLVGSLGTRQLARRPLRYTRASLLLMLAMSMGVFAVSYASTWVDSQRDQAEFQVGADVRVVPARGPSALPAWALAAAYGSVDGVVVAMPVERQRLRMPNGTASGELLALGTEAASRVVTMRADLAEASVADLVQPLVSARPAVAGIPVAGQPRRLLVTASVAIAEIGSFRVDPFTGEVRTGPLDIAILAGRPVLSAMVYVRDAGGVLHSFESEPVPLTEVEEMEIPLSARSPAGREAVASTDAGLSFPIELMGVDLEISLPRFTLATVGAIGLDGVAASDEQGGASRREIDLGQAGAWRLGWWQGPGSETAAIPADEAEDLFIDLGIPSFPALAGVSDGGHGVTVSFIPADVAGLATTELSAAVNGQFLAQTASQVGDLVSLELEGGDRNVRIVGTFVAFPTTDPGRPAAIVDLPSMSLLRLQSAHATRIPSEWWLAADDRAAAAAGTRSSSGAFARAAVITRIDRTASLGADPLALGIIGALALGFVVAGLFAVIGLAASAAVSARQRRDEFALLRALGLSGGQLSGWLWLENASLVVVSLLAGTGLGLLIAWVVLPFITVTQQATTPYPPLIVETPWMTILMLEAVSAAALALTVIGLATVLRRAGVGSVLRMGGD